MKSNKNIHDKHSSQECSALNGLKPTTTTFDVPENYFDTFAINMLEKVTNLTDEEKNTLLEDTMDVPTFLPKVATEMPFEVPEQFFEDFATKMVAHIDAMEMSEESPILDSIAPTMPFEVPTGYFDQFAAQMLATSIAAVENNELALSKVVPFEIPNDYFDSLPSQVMNVIENSNQELFSFEEFNILASISKSMPYEVPNNYFETLPVTLKTNIAAENDDTDHQAVTIPFFKRIKWANSVAAACVMLFLILGVGIVKDEHGHNAIGLGTYATASEKAAYGLSQMSDEAIENYLHDNAEEFEVNLLETTVVEKITEKQTVVHSTTTTDNTISQDVLQNVSDEDILEYLDY